jgi:parvulin-like peptidyl-prolyl isomerase
MTLRVNGRTIPEKAVLAELKRLIDFYSQHLSRTELGERMAELVKKARAHAVGTQLLIEEVKRRHVVVPNEEVEVAVEGLAKQAGGARQLAEVLARQGMSLEQLRATVRAGKQLDQLVARVTSGVAECSEQEIRTYFEKNAERYVAPDQVQARHILINPASAEEPDKAVARSTLLSLRHKILEGEDFADLAAAHSECASGKSTGGSLGWIARGSTLPEFEKAVFDELDVGDISSVIETPLGFHIVEKLDHEEGANLPFEQVRDSIRELLMHERKGHALTEFVDRLRQDAVIEDDDEDAEKWEAIADSFLDGEKGS